MQAALKLLWRSSQQPFQRWMSRLIFPMMLQTVSKGSLTKRTCSSLRALTHLAALLLQTASALLLPLPTEHGSGLLVRIRFMRHDDYRTTCSFGLSQNGYGHCSSFLCCKIYSVVLTTSGSLAAEVFLWCDALLRTPCRRLYQLLVSAIVDLVLPPALPGHLLKTFEMVCFIVGCAR